MTTATDPRSSGHARTDASSVRAGTASASWSPRSPRRRLARAASRPPVNLAFVLDRSGSMDGQKLRLAAQAVEEAIGRLRPSDRFAVVIYDDVVETLVPGTPATPGARRARPSSGCARIAARNMTDLSGGWLAGCEQVASALLEEGVNRCLLLTDGLANRGITDRDELARHAGELRARGVSTSTFGVGDDFDEVLLQSMAAAGGGHFYFIERPPRSATTSAARSARRSRSWPATCTLEVTLPDTSGRVAGGLPGAGRRGSLVIELGDLVSGQQVEVPLRLFFGFGEIGDIAAASWSASSDRDGGARRFGRSPGLEYADDRRQRRPATRPLRRPGRGRRSSRPAPARMRWSSIGAASMRPRRGASRRRPGRSAATPAGDAELGAIVDGLLRESETFGQVMSERERKQRYAMSVYLMRSRDVRAGQREGTKPGPGARPPGSLGAGRPAVGMVVWP